MYVELAEVSVALCLTHDVKRQKARMNFSVKKRKECVVRRTVVEQLNERCADLADTV
jgi:hypothetical protein